MKTVPVNDTTKFPRICIVSVGMLVELRHSAQTDWLEAVRDFERLLIVNPHFLAHFGDPAEPGKVLNLVTPVGTLCNCMAVQAEAEAVKTVGGYVRNETGWQEPLWFFNFPELTALCAVLNLKQASFLQSSFDKLETAARRQHASERPPDSTVH